jgi:hemerythrin
MDPVKRIKVLTDCGANAAALRAEHTAIEDALDTLDHAVIAGATTHQLTDILRMVYDFQEAHFCAEELMLIESGFPGLAAHASAHQGMLQRLHDARSSLQGGDLEAALDASDLINCFHDHVATYDRAAHTYLIQQQVKKGAEPLPGQAELISAAGA